MAAAPEPHGLSERDLAIHDLGGQGPTVLYAHATGFHARCWEPVAAALPQFHNVAYDARGHGDTPAPQDWDVNWDVYGDDAATVARRVGGGSPMIGVGHSMGGAALLIAALSTPELFRALVVYEPIVFPIGPEMAPPPGEGGGNRLAIGARRRRAAFASFEAAIENFSSKPPMSIFDAEAVKAYVLGGFAPDKDGQVHLKCHPEHEARTYESGGTHRTWLRLPELTVPVWVVSGRVEPEQPSRFAELLAEQIPSSRYIRLDQLGHFGPMEQPQLMADIIERLAAATDPAG